MLVLTRKLMEKLFIGDDICVTVVRLEGGQVRLGIEAPREVTVVRAELVPERQRGTQRGGVSRPSAQAHVGDPRVVNSAPGATGPGLRIPQASAHGIGNRRREPSR